MSTQPNPPPTCEQCKRLAALVKRAYIEGLGPDFDSEYWEFSDAKRELDKIMGEANV